jgi:hypothetical protein
MMLRRTIAAPRNRRFARRPVAVAAAQTFQELGIFGANLETNSSYFGHQFYVSTLPTSRGVNDGVACDADGWPTAGFTWIISTQQGNLPAGTGYKGKVISRTGSPVTVTNGSGCVVTNVVNSGNETTFDLETDSSTLNSITFSAGVSFVELKRAGFSLADTTVFNPAANTYYGPFASIRFLKLHGVEYNNTELNWTGGRARFGTATLGGDLKTWTWNGHSVSNNERLTLSVSGGTLPSGMWLTLNPSVSGQSVTPLYARNVTANTLEVSFTKDGPSITAASAGSGTFTLSAIGRPTPSNNKFGSNLSHEQTVALSNHLRYGAGVGNLRRIYLSTPFAAGDDYITSMLTYYRDNLHSSIEILLEQDNEHWNLQYPGFYYWIQQGLSATKTFLYNGTAFRQILSVVRASNVATVTMHADFPLSVHGWPASGTHVINCNVPGSSGFGFNAVTVTITGTHTFTYASSGSDVTVTGSTLDNAFFCGDPTSELNYDSANSFPVWAKRASTKRHRETALIAETVFGSLMGRIKPVICHQQVLNAPSTTSNLQNNVLIRSLEFLESQYPARSIRSLFWGIGVAPYATLSMSVANTKEAVLANWQTAVDNNLLDFAYHNEICTLFGIRSFSYELGLSSQGNAYSSLTLATLKTAYDDDECRRLQYDHHMGSFLRGSQHSEHFEAAPSVYPTSGTNREYFYMQDHITDPDSPRRTACLQMLATPYPTTGFTARNVVTGGSSGLQSTVAMYYFTRIPFHGFSGSNLSWQFNSSNGNGLGITNNHTFAVGQWVDKAGFYIDTDGEYDLTFATSLGGTTTRTCTVELNRLRADAQGPFNFDVIGNSGGSTGAPAYVNGNLRVTLTKGWHAIRFQLPQGVNVSFKLGDARFTKV